MLAAFMQPGRNAILVVRCLQERAAAGAAVMCWLRRCLCMALVILCRLLQQDDVCCCRHHVATCYTCMCLFSPSSYVHIQRCVMLCTWPALCHVMYMYSPVSWPSAPCVAR
jgi:hypothetical protein